MEKMQKKQKASWKWLLAVTAAVLLIVCGCILVYQMLMAVDTSVMLEVNPAIALKLNRQERILEASAENDDAVKILDGMELKGTTLNTAVNAIIGSMVKNGYISEKQNSILISVDSRDKQKEQQLQKQLTEDIDALLRQNSLSGAVLGQTLSQDKELEKLAEQYHISTGKAALIQEICRQNKSASFGQLAAMSINDLNLLIGQKEVKLQEAISTGQASCKAYITSERAQELALAQAGATAAQAAGLKTEMNQENGIMTYEVSFVFNHMEYEYTLHAESGAILKTETEPLASDDIGGTGSAAPPHGAYIDSEKAKEIAFGHAGEAAGNVTCQKVEFDQKDAEYEIYFTAKDAEYEYDIDAVTGKVLSYEKKSRKTLSVSEENAKKTALDDAGIKEKEICSLEIELDTDHGQEVYEITFIKGNTEYEYKISTADGRILERKTERND